ncbi:hypothetical protein Anapl_01473 [Anas platyrhynchos]|uniref:Uncharacterized protein n=1 Tax=Anas platyrhynchos TaxID=8839 RepID=R0M2D0_ANAPL|nr:hypothetical protein Anapl_01473 [Anas platyrhynchos]
MNFLQTHLLDTLREEKLFSTLQVSWMGAVDSVSSTAVIALLHVKIESEVMLLDQQPLDSSRSMELAALLQVTALCSSVLSCAEEQRALQVPPQHVKDKEVKSKANRHFSGIRMIVSEFGMYEGV